MAEATGASSPQEHEYVRRGAELTAVPNEVAAKGMALHSLDLSCNNLQELPDNLLASLPALKSLILSENQLKSIPDSISKLSTLQLLDVSKNQLKTLPASVCQLQQLQQLLVSGNAITELLGPYNQMTSLQVLDVRNSQLEVLPSGVGWLPLKQLLVEGTPRLRIPQSVLDAGLRATLSYLQVVCEQHRLVELHLAKFSAPPATGDAAAKQPPPLTPSEPWRSAYNMEARMEQATKTGVLDLAKCGLTDGIMAARRIFVHSLAAVYVLDARYNGWETLPESLVALNGLVVLNASHNNLRVVEDGAVPSSLGVLDLSFNNLSELPESLGQAPVLQQMYLANNKLSDIPESYARLPMVDLFLSENNFTKVPTAVFGMKQLSKLSMACCQLMEVPPELGKVTTLRFLDLSFNRLTTLPWELKALVGLNALNLSFNPLPKLPSVVARLTSLLELNLDYTGISEVPPDIGQLRRLEGLQAEGTPLVAPYDQLYASDPLLLVHIHNKAIVSLDLSSVGLSHFPAQVVNLTNLTALDLSDNKLSSLPPEFGQMTQLKRINLRNNPWGTPFKQLLELHGEQAVLAYCDVTGDVADLCNCQLDTLPPEVVKRGAAVQQLKLANNQLAVLPAQLSALSNLHTVLLDNNKLPELPKVLFEIPSLTLLMAANNQIACLPDAVGNCTQLQALVLPGNLIQALPSSIGRLKALKALNLSQNQLSGELPAVLGDCSSLCILEVTSNKLTSLSKDLAKLTQLRTLKAGCNQLSCIPHELMQLTSLQELQLSGNAFTVADESAALDASTTPACLEILKLLAAPVPQPQQPASQPTGQQLTEHDPAPPQVLLQQDAHAPEVAAVVELIRNSATPRGSSRRNQPTPVPITTAESQESEAAKVLARAQAEQDAAQAKWLYLQKHQETLAQDPLRASTLAQWDHVPLLHIPRIIAALSSPPAPPAPAGAVNDSTGDGVGDRGPSVAATSPTRRPQTLYRFKRLMDQSSMAIQLLGRVNTVLQQKADEKAAAAAAVSAAAPAAPQVSVGTGLSASQQQLVLDPQQHQQLIQEAYQAGLQAAQQHLATMGMHQPGTAVAAGALGPAPPGMAPVMMQKKVGNKVVMIPVYQVVAPATGSVPVERASPQSGSPVRRS